MKMFVWKENLKNGAYHEDGSAVVIAPTLEYAISMVATKREAKEGWHTYNWDTPMEQTEPSEIIDLPDEVEPRIVLLTVGCDC